MKKTILFLVGLFLLSLYSNAQLVCDPVSPNLVSNSHMSIHGPLIIIPDDQALTNVCAWDKAVPTNTVSPWQGASLYHFPNLYGGRSVIRAQPIPWIYGPWAGFYQSINAKQGTTVTLDVNLLLDFQVNNLQSFHFVVCLTNANVLDQTLYTQNYLNFPHQVLLDEYDNQFNPISESWQNIIKEINIDNDYSTLVIYLYNSYLFQSMDTDLNRALVPSEVAIDWINLYQHELTVDAGENDEQCFGTHINIGGNPTAFGGVPGYTYSWSSFPGGFSSDEANPEITVDQTRTYSVTVKDHSTPPQIVSDYVTIVAVECPLTNVLRVNASNPHTVANDGTSWGLAFTHLQDALSAASNNPEIDQIWIAEGTYYPDWNGSFFTGDRSARFTMLQGVAIYGGFSGTEGYLGARSNYVEDHPTILSGNINKPFEEIDNSYAIVSFNEITDGVLDRVTLEKAYNYDSPSPNYSHALEIKTSTLAANDCKIKNNCNKTIYIDHSDVLFRNSFIEDNRGNSISLYAEYSNVSMENCTIRNNSGTGMVSGVLHFRESEISMVNCLIKSNELSSGEYMSSGVMLVSSSASIVDCDFIKNTTESNGPTAIWITDLYSYSGSHEINVLVQGCRFEGVGYGNISVSPTIQIILYGHYVDNPAQVSVENSVFYNNTPPHYSSVNRPSGTISVLLLDGIANDKIKLLNNTFYSAEAEYYGGYDIYAYFPVGWNDHITVTNCILWDGTGHNKIGTADGSALPVTYSDVEGGYGLPIDKNIDENPLYADALNGDFHLQSPNGRWDPIVGWVYTDNQCSPCIDAGDPASGSGGGAEPEIPNMGAYGNTSFQSKTCAITKSLLLASDDSNSLSETFFDCFLSPNPISKSLKIELNLSKDSEVEVSIFDLMGRRSRTINSGYLTSGNKIMYWNGQDEANNQLPNGIYLVVVKNNNTVQSYKVLLNR